MRGEGFARGYERDVRIDSTAAIGAISRGALSERKRVRAAGRAWLNFCRKDFLEKRDKIQIEHVSSHKGTESQEQKGNDTADKIANTYRRLGQATDAVPYFTEAEERFLLKHKDILIQQDVRVFLKALEKEVMVEIWKEKAPKQAQWFVKYPQQIMKQAKQAWKWAIAAGDGQAWLYFIFGVCQWLPTNHRVYYADNSGTGRTKCKLCLMDTDLL